MKYRVGVEQPDVGNLIIVGLSAMLSEAKPTQPSRLQDADRVGRSDVPHHLSSGFCAGAERKDEVSQASFGVLTQRRQALLHRAESNRL